MAAAAGALQQPLLDKNKESWRLKHSPVILSLVLNAVSACGLIALLILQNNPALRSDSWSIAASSAPSWWRKAAAEAEKAASVPCSGHGRAFVDSVEVNGALCECNRCFTGQDCSQKAANCTADADSGDPLFLEPFWDANAEAGAVVIAPWHRMGYSVQADAEHTSLSSRLENLIRQLHHLAGNAITEGRFIVIGTGSMELINAAVASLAPQPHSPSPPAIVVSRPPYYTAYETQTTFFSSTQYRWGGDPLKAARHFSNSNSTFIEFVAAPNNPDASMPSDPALNFSSAVFDRAYYWPHFVPITRTIDDDLMLFTLSKLTGHAGSRLGWAIVKDYQVYSRMLMYTRLNTIGVSHDTQLRAAKLLEAVIEGYLKQSPPSPSSAHIADPDVYAASQHIFHFAHSVMKSRWQRLQNAFQNSTRFTLQQLLKPQYCNFFKKVTTPGPAYAWIKCEEQGAYCVKVLEAAGIIGRNGFGMDNEQHVRLAMIRGNDDFDNLMDHLNELLRNPNKSGQSK